ncbi:MAG: hypothetical protein H7249_17300 [Chitinophagaceae bacterium]|nr:hypothetical protein [Oligoflexus sp.]
MNLSRRDLVMQTLFGTGLVGIQSLATGLPISLITNPQRAMAADVLNGFVNPQFLIFSTSSSGDPLNCNVPGTYDDADIGHANDPSMAATPITLGNGTVVKGAQVWSTLAPALLARTCFFHHSTYTVVHPDENKVLRLMGQIQQSEMLPSLLSRELSSVLGTIRSQPISLSGNVNETIYYQSAPQPLITPTTLANVLGAPANGLGTPALLKIRDKNLDNLNAWLKSYGTNSQKRFVDQFAISRAQLRTMQDGLLTSLAAIDDDSPLSQIRAAIILFQMKVSPVATIHIPFGGDNHNDEALANEVQDHTDALTTLNGMQSALVAANMQDKVSFGLTNVFGRTLRKDDVVNGRNHNDSHHVSLMMGANVKGSLIGGLGNDGKSFKALGLDSSTGLGTNSGDIAYSDTFASMGKTMAKAVGFSDALIDANIRIGKTIRSALV